MNKRDAKRRACRIAAQLLRRWLVADFDTDDDGDGICHDDITVAGNELVEELERRGSDAGRSEKGGRG